MLLIVLGFGAIIAIDLPMLIKKKNKPAIIAFCALTTIAIIFSILLLINVTIPSPLVMLSDLVSKILNIPIE